MPSFSDRLAAMRKVSNYELEWDPSTFAPPEHRHLSNADMDPVPPRLRTWMWYNYLTFWFSDAFSVSGLQQAGSLVAVGLSPPQAMSVIVVGHIFMGMPISAMGYIGAINHVPFPVLSRMTFGFWFSYLPVLIRAFMASFYFGIQTYTGAQCCAVCIGAIWPSFNHFPNSIPVSQNITSANLICYVIFWFIQLPFLLISPKQLRWLFAAKAITGPATGFALMGWGFYNGANTIFQKAGTLQGSKLAWAWLSGVNSIMGGSSTYAINMNDFTRYAKGPREQWVILVAIPVMYSIIGLQGVAAAAGGQHLYGVLQWNPVVLIQSWDSRAGKFFVAASLAFTCIGTNVSGNSLAAGNDFTAMAPRFINLRRGSFLCAFIGGWICCPWQVLASANSLLAFLSGYGSLLTPIYALLICSYYVVHKYKIDIPALYRPHARYYFWKGINWRSAVAMVIPWGLAIPGLAHAVNPKLVLPAAIINYYNLGWLMNFWIAFIIYAFLSKVFPDRASECDHLITGDEEKPTPSMDDEMEMDDSKISPDEKEPSSIQVVPVLEA